MSKPDAVDRQNPAVDMLATRKADGTTLAVEHTIIEPFVGDKEDFASFGPAFLAIEQDHSLLMPGRWLEVLALLWLARTAVPDEPRVRPERCERVRAELLKLFPRLGRRKIEMNERIHSARMDQDWYVEQLQHNTPR